MEDIAMKIRTCLKIWRLYFFALVAACILAVPVSVSAAWAPYTRTEASGWYGTNTWSSLGGGGFSDSVAQEHTDGTPSTSQTGYSHSNPVYDSGSVFGEASAEIGLIRMFASGSSSAINPGDSSYISTTTQGYARGRWDDNFTIDGGALNGQRGHLTAGFSVSGSFTENHDSSINGAANLSQYFRASLRLSNAAAGQDAFAYGGQQFRQDYNGGSEGTYSSEPFRAPGIWPIEIDFIFGTPIDVSSWGDAAVTVNAYASSPYMSSNLGAEADFGNTMYWNGITGVTDSLGNPVTNYTMSSGSGFDYRYSAVVPLPAAAWLFGSGLLGLIGVARGKARKTRRRIGG